MRYLFLVSLLVMRAGSSIAQTETVYAYYNKDWKQVSNPNLATYYRTVEPKDSMYIVRDWFSASNKMQMEAMCSEISPELEFNGQVTWYYENGVVKRQGNFVENRESGFFRERYENGNTKSEKFFKEKKMLYYQHWSRDGRPLLVNGTGIIGPIDSTQTGAYCFAVEDSSITASFSISFQTHDTLFALTDKMPEYEGGLAKAYQEISRSIVYPKGARKRGIQGTVYIGFIVDTTGKTTGASVIKGISDECDAEAIKAVSSLSHWQPGSYKGRKVSVKYVLPVKYKLS